METTTPCGHWHTEPVCSVCGCTATTDPSVHRCRRQKLDNFCVSGGGKLRQLSSTPGMASVNAFTCMRTWQSPRTRSPNESKESLYHRRLHEVRAQHAQLCLQVIHAGLLRGLQASTLPHLSVKAIGLCFRARGRGHVLHELARTSPNRSRRKQGRQIKTEHYRMRRCIQTS